MKSQSKINFLIFIIVLSCLFVSPSFALLSSSFASPSQYTSKLPFDSLGTAIENKNYTDLVVSLPDLVYNSNGWTEKFNNVNSTGLSILDIAESYGGYVYINWPEYAHAKILIPNENYSEFVGEFTSLGFKVENNTYLKILLDDSKKSIGLPYQYSIPSINLTGKGTIIALIDTGIDNTYQDFPTGKIIGWRDWTSAATTPYDDNGHGTHAASIAAGTGLASGGRYSGIAPNANLVIEKACISGGSCDPDFVANGTQDVIQYNPDVISLSLGISGPSADWCNCATSDAEAKGICDAIKNAIARNITVVAAAGNEGPSSGSVDFPACINGVIAVGSALKKDYSNELWTENLGSDYHVNLKVDNGSTSVNYNYALNKSSNLFSSFQKLIQTNGPSQIKVSVNEQNLDWCQANSNGDLAVACTNLKPDAITLLYDCRGDCRDNFVNSPNKICNDFFGSSWYTTGIDCENIDIDHISNGNYTRNFDMVWNNDPANQANGWCPGVDPPFGDGGTDMSITCSYLPAKPELKVMVRDCKGNCNNQGTPNQVCKENGADWHAIEVDCETVTVNGGSANKTFDDNVGSWCQDGGGEDLTVTCERGNLLNKAYKTTILNCNGDCTNKGTPDKICQNTYGSGWYSQFVDCENMGLNPPENVIIRYLDSSMSFPSSQNVDVNVVKPKDFVDEYGIKHTFGVNDIEVSFDNVSKFSTEGAISYFSSRGPPVQSPTLLKPDVTAPGSSICAARGSGEILTSSGDCSLSCGNNNYMSCSGTSMAAPMVSGVVALMKEARSNANSTDIINAIRKADLKMSNQPNMIEGYGFINVSKAVNSLTNCSKGTRYITQTYLDSINDPRQCSGYNYNSYSSENQLRFYGWSDAIQDCDCSVTYDSYITRVAVNDATAGDTGVLNKSNIEVYVDINNTGTQQQSGWLVGVDFWKANDYNNPSIKTQEVYTWLTKSSNGNSIGLSGAGCSLVNDPNGNNNLDPGETIRVKCWVPASYFGSTSGNQRIMFSAEEKDIYHSYIILSKINVASVMVKIVCSANNYDSDGGKNYITKGVCSDYYTVGTACQKNSYKDYSSCIPKCNFGSPNCYIGVVAECAKHATSTGECSADENCTSGMIEYYLSGAGCGWELRRCSDLGSNYFSLDGKCAAFIINITSPLNSSYYFKPYVPLSFNAGGASQIGYSLDYQPPIAVSLPFNLTNISNGLHSIIVYATDSSFNIGSSNDTYFYYCKGDINKDGKVDITDVASTAKLFGCTSSKSCYYGTTNGVPNSAFDFDEDGKIDITDVANVAKLFGSKC